MSADVRKEPHPEARTIAVDGPPEVAVKLPSAGTVTLRWSGEPERVVAAARRRPLAANYRAFADELIAACLHPRRPRSVVGELSEAERRKLMLAVVRLREEGRSWRMLYGSALSHEERFFAVMLWAAQRDWERLRARLLAARKRALADAGRRDRPRVSPGASAVFRSPLLATDFSKLLAPALGTMPSYQQLVGTSGLQRLFAQQPVLAAAERWRKQAPLGVASEVSAALARSGVDRGSVPAGFASVLRPYARNPYSRAGTLGSVRLADPLTSPSALSGLSAVAAQLSRGVRPVDVSKLIGGSLSKQLDVAGLAGLGALTGRGAGSPLDVARLVDTARVGLGVDATRLAQGVLNGLPRGLIDRPLFDGRQGLFAPPGALSALVPAAASVRLPTIDFASQLRGALAPLRGLGELFIEVSEFMRVWEDDPLWFLLSIFGMGAARRFAGLTREQVEEALLSALADVVREGEFVAALREVLRDAPHLNGITREWLDHALAHAAAGEWVQAVPPMLAGLEGALHRAAVERALVIDRGGKFMAVEALVKQMAVDEDYTAFLIRRVFGGIGNAFRHGRADSGERDQVLFAIVAVAGWVDFFLELSAMDVLAGELGARLDASISQVVASAPELPAPA